ncbi:hypothetical protein [Nocardia sp. CA-119907]|uniref:hypothetical protein n=1 Tax=Nocardia sp. CA-119907 TaxID=3239973 RepID=UPI003D96DE71
MAFELAPAVFGLAGTLVGGGVTFAANWLTARNQHRIAVASRSDALRDRQHAAHLGYLAAADKIVGGCRLILVLERRDQAQALEQHRDAVMQMWSQLLDPRAAAQLAGPPELMPVMGEFHSALAQLHDFVEDFCRLRSSATADCRGEADLLWEKALEKRSAYIAAAQGSLN